PDCVLLDYLMPDLDGLEFLAHLSETTGARQVPVIMLTVQGNESVVAQAFKHGVEDCLTKNDLSAERLRRAITSALEHGDMLQANLALRMAGSIKDVTERKQAQERLNASVKEVTDLKAARDEHANVAITHPPGRII